MWDVWVEWSPGTSQENGQCLDRDKQDWLVAIQWATWTKRFGIVVNSPLLSRLNGV